MTKGLRIFISILLLAYSFSYEFVQITHTDKTHILLNEANPLQAYELTCKIEKETDTIIRFITAALNPIKTKMYIYYTKEEAEADTVFNAPKWTNIAEGQELIAHLNLAQAEFLPQLFIIFKCIDCTGEKTYDDTFEITNELQEVVSITPGTKYSAKTLYSKKTLFFSMKKTKTSNGFRFIYTPVTKQTMTVETYFNAQKINEQTKDTQIQLTRNEEYDSTAEYLVTVKVTPNIDETIFELTVDLAETIQTILAEPLERIQLDFNKAQHDLYFYVDLSRYEKDEDSTITLSIKQAEGQAPITPIIYSKDVDTTKPVNEYDTLMPIKAEDSIFNIYNRDNKHFSVYFKKNKSILLININFIKEGIQEASLILSAKAFTLDDTFIEGFGLEGFGIDDYVPYHFIISSFKYATNLLVYAPVMANQPQTDSHRVFLGSMVNKDLSINTKVISYSLLAIQNKESYYATYEFFGKEQMFTLYYEPVNSLSSFEIDYRKNTKEKHLMQLGIIGKTYYFIETSPIPKTDPKTYFGFIEEMTGKYEYGFANSITLSSQIKTLLPSNTGSSKGLEQVTTEFIIYAIKVLSPGQIAIGFREDTPNTLDLTEFISHSLIFNQGKQYKMSLPYIAEKEFGLRITVIKYQAAEDEIEFKIGGKIETLKEGKPIQIIYSAPLQIVITPSIKSSLAVEIRVIDQTELTVIDSKTTSINDPNVIMKFQESDVADYIFMFEKDQIAFKYDIGIGKEMFITPALNPTKAKARDIWLRLANPNLQSKNYMSPSEYHFLTMGFDAGIFPLKINIVKTTIPERPQLDINKVSQLQYGTMVTIAQSKDYTPEQNNLIIIASSCLASNTDKEHNLSLFYYQGFPLKTWSFGNKKKVLIEHLNPNIPLYLKYSDDDFIKDTSLSSIKDEATPIVLVSYNFISDASRDAAKALLDKKIDITNDGYELSWTSYSEKIKDYRVYWIKEGSNTTALDNECYLNTLKDFDDVKDTKKTLASNLEGKYAIVVVALNKDAIQFNIVSEPKVVDLSGSSLLWLWILLGIIGGLLIVGGGIAGFLFYRKKFGSQTTETKSLLPEAYD